MIRSAAILFLLFWAHLFLAQTNLSGVVNQYYSVQSVDYTNFRLTLDNTSGISIGDTLFLIQMKGATINTSNDPNYGTTTFYNGAGMNELVEICDIQGNTVTLKKQLTFPTYSASGGLQLIGFPDHADINITGAVTAQPWNGSTGGVVFMRASGNITLNASIDVSGQGFRGGTQILSPFSCSWALNIADYEYAASSGLGAMKGEGIANYTANNGGRGALANGGGGGNDHNTGGAGGGNMSAGGDGGINDEPGQFNCDGDFGGIGGKQLNNFDRRIFFGGGGGAGHANNNGSDGGNGGGIVILIADQIVGNGNVIRADGTDGGHGIGDGGSGGGAGGSIFLMADNFSGSLDVIANGGIGGNGDGDIGASANTNRCFGPGGGGSGGFLWFKGGTAPAGVNSTLNGGVSGTVTNSTQASCLGSKLGATDGNTGVIQFDGTIFQSNKINKSCSTNPVLDLGADTTTCAGTVTLTAGVAGTYTWSTGETTSSIDVTASGTYTVDVDLGDCIICDTILVTIDPLAVNLGPDQSFCQGGSLTLDAGPNGTTYLWSTNETTQTIDVNTSGTYSVTVSNAQCTNTDEINLTVFPNPVPIADSAELCSYLGVTLDAENPGASYDWSTGETTPTINVDATGIYTVEIDYGGNCSITEQIEVVACENELFVPNTFTPNGDGSNDTWVIRGLIAYPGNRISVFNRNGSLVYEATNYDGSWNGDNLPEAAYFYVLDLNNGGNLLEGSISIVR